MNTGFKILTGLHPPKRPSFSEELQSDPYNEQAIWTCCYLSAALFLCEKGEWALDLYDHFPAFHVEGDIS